MVYAIIGIILGILFGFILPITYEYTYTIYISMILLALIDGVMGGIKANLYNKFTTKEFLLGILGNALLSISLSYIGEVLGVPLYYGGIIVFSIKIFKNFTFIRKYYSKKQKKK